MVTKQPTFVRHRVISVKATEPYKPVAIQLPHLPKHPQQLPLTLHLDPKTRPRHRPQTPPRPMGRHRPIPPPNLLQPLQPLIQTLHNLNPGHGRLRPLAPRQQSHELSGRQQEEYGEAGGGVPRDQEGEVEGQGDAPAEGDARGEEV